MVSTVLRICTNYGFFFCSRANSKTGESTPTSKLQIYSLTAHQVIKTIDFGEGPDYELSTLDVNERGIVVVRNDIKEFIVVLFWSLIQQLFPCTTGLEFPRRNY